MSDLKRMRNKKTRHALLDLCEFLPFDIVGMEIGSFAGESSEVFIQSDKFRRLYCIDPWNTNACEQNNAEQRFDVVNSKYSSLIKCKGTLDDHYRNIDTVQFTYIDARHEFEHTLKFIFQALLLSTVPCFIGGHDYNCRKFPGVTRAVNMIAGEKNLITFEDHSFLTMIKPEHKTAITAFKPTKKYLERE